MRRGEIALVAPFEVGKTSIWSLTCLSEVPMRPSMLVGFILIPGDYDRHSNVVVGSSVGRYSRYRGMAAYSRDAFASPIRGAPREAVSGRLWSGRDLRRPLGLSGERYRRSGAFHRCATSHDAHEPGCQTGLRFRETPLDRLYRCCGSRSSGGHLQ